VSGPTVSDTAVRNALREVIDPEVGINIVDLGLVYGIQRWRDGVAIALTMTSVACPLAEYLTDEVVRCLRQRVPGLDRIAVDLVWDPPWTPARMSAAARRQLGWPDETDDATQA
jgi:metal-sulfur cluster biosynthetic enzyme